MSSADTIVKRALNACGAHSEFNPASPEMLAVGLEQLQTLLGELVEDQVFIGKKLTSLTSAGLVATGTLADHGFATGDDVYISGADQAAYVGEFELTGDAANTFTYALAEAADTPATALRGADLRVFCYPNELGDEIGERRGAATDLAYALAVSLELVTRLVIKAEHRPRALAARGNLEHRFCAPTIPNVIPSRLLPRGQGSSRGVQPAAFMSGEALDDDSAS